MIYTRKHFQEDKQFQMVKRKGVFPYDHLDSLDRFNETKLPNRSKFFNKLEDKRPPLRDIFRAHLTWKYLKCQTMGDYHDVYLKSDVLLLTDFFKKFRQTCLKNL